MSVSNHDIEKTFLRKKLLCTSIGYCRLSMGKVELRGSCHHFKYRLALVSEGICHLRYDNEAGKGDHKHVEDREVPYHFVDLETLQVDFWTDVETWRTSQ